MHNITEVLLKNHQIMPYKRKTPINNFGVVKNKCCTSYTNNSNNINYSKNNHKCRKMSPLMFLLIIVIIIIELCCTTTGVNCNIITANNINKNYLSSTKPWNSINKNNKKIILNQDNNQLTARTTKEEYLKSLQQVFMSTLVSNNSFKNGSSIDKVRYY